MNKKLNIAFVLDDGLDKPDGVQQNILTIGAWLESNGHKVSYLVGETKRKDIKNAITMSTNKKVVFNGNTLSMPLLSSSKKINEVLENGNFDVIHVQVPYSPFMGARVVNRSYKKSVVVGTFHIMPNSKLSYFGTKILGLYLRSNLKKFDKHFAVSGPAVKFANETFNINANVLGNPIDTKKFQLKSERKTISNDFFNIVFLGRLVARKGCLDLVKAIKILKDQGISNFKLTIAGDGSQRKNIEQYISDNNLSNTIKLIGFIAEKDKSKLLHEADIAVFPSSGGESFGIVLLEAMASGSKVVLAGDNVGYRSVLSEVPESLFEPNSPDELAELLNKIMKSNDLQKKINTGQQKIVKKFDIENIGNELVENYYSLLNEKTNSLH